MLKGLHYVLIWYCGIFNCLNKLNIRKQSPLVVLPLARRSKYSKPEYGKPTLIFVNIPKKLPGFFSFPSCLGQWYRNG